MVLHDVTSSYVEGEKNELADYGYNRDKKKNKQQIVTGLMTDPEGCPVSVEVFPGNTADVSTHSAQVAKLPQTLIQASGVGGRPEDLDTEADPGSADATGTGLDLRLKKNQISKVVELKQLQTSLFDA